LVYSKYVVYLYNNLKQIEIMKVKEFTLFWLTGDSQIITGTDIANAMNSAGIGNGALRALDFHAKGDVREKYIWNRENRTWDNK